MLNTKASRQHTAELPTATFAHKLRINSFISSYFTSSPSSIEWIVELMFLQHIVQINKPQPVKPSPTAHSEFPTLRQLYPSHQHSPSQMRQLYRQRPHKGKERCAPLNRTPYKQTNEVLTFCKDSFLPVTLIHNTSPPLPALVFQQ